MLCVYCHCKLIFLILTTCGVFSDADFAIDDTVKCSKFFKRAEGASYWVLNRPYSVNSSGI